MKNSELLNDKKKNAVADSATNRGAIKNNSSSMSRREFLEFTASAVSASLVASAIGSLEALAQNKPPKKTPVFLQGHYRPQIKETTNTALKVRGAIPPALAGRYFRNSHNPPPDQVKGFWFGGQGMIHGVRLKNGRAEWYRNRYVQTPTLKGAPLFKKDGSIDLTASVAGTNVYAHAGRILALQEINLPFEVSPELETLGVFDFDGALKTMMTAHPKTDPETGEMLFLSNSPLPPHLTYHVADKNGKLVHSEVIEGPGASVIHDFAFTKNYVLWFDSSVTLDLESGLAFPYTWNDKYPAKIGIMPRDRSKGATRWIEMPPFFSFHLSNAFEDASGKIVVEGTFYDRKDWEHAAKWINSLADHGNWIINSCRWTRWTLDPKTLTAEVKHLDDLAADYPTINPAFVGKRNRYTYTEVIPSGKLKNHAVGKFDGQTGTGEIREFKPGQMPGEAYFVADPNGTKEDDGWLFTYINDLSAQRSELWILDATNIKAKPTAVIELGAWVPQGVHGSWISDAELGK